MATQFKIGDKVRLSMGDGIITPNYPVIPMTVKLVEPQADGTTQVTCSQAWYYNGFTTKTDSRWLEMEK